MTRGSAVRLDDGLVGRVDQVREAGRQVGEGGDDAQHGGDHRGDVEAAVDRLQAALALAGPGDVDADDGGEHADGRHDQREEQALQTERGGAQDEGGDQHHGVGLEQVGGHAGAVADVVADVVRDRGGVARVVLRDALLDLADEVRADVGGLGEDAAADPHEHRQQRRAEAEALQDAGRLTGVDEHDDRGTEEAEADGEHADDATGAERDAGGLLPAALLAGGGGDADVRPGGQPHAEVTDRRGEHRADHEEDGPADPLADIVGGQGEQQYEDHDDEDCERAELAVEIGSGAFLDRSADLLHLVGALAGGQHLAEQDEADGQGGERDRRDHTDDDAVARGELEARRDCGGQIHPSSWFMGTLRPGNVTAPLASCAPKPHVKMRRGRVQCKCRTGRTSPGDVGHICRSRVDEESSEYGGEANSDGVGLVRTR